MARLVIELTNRCNLRCAHCYDERHAATGELPLSAIEAVVRDAARCGIDHLCLSGGEPTIHTRFATILERIADAGYGFSVVTNGRDGVRVAQLYLRHRRRFRGVTFSLDGAREATHDRSRGRGSYRQVMRAATACFFRKLPFTFNMVLTAYSQDEVDEMVALAGGLGSRGVRFGHLMFTPQSASRGLDLTPAERRSVEARIWALKKGAPIAVDMAPGYFSESPFFPCAPLELEELNLDYRGNVTLCCHLSGYPGLDDAGDVLGNVEDIGFEEAFRLFRSRVASYLADKRERVIRGNLDELDHFPCWYCVKYVGRAPLAEGFPPRAWRPAGAPAGRRLHVIESHAASRP